VATVQWFMWLLCPSCFMWLLCPWFNVATVSKLVYVAIVHWFMSNVSKLVYVTTVSTDLSGYCV